MCVSPYSTSGTVCTCTQSSLTMHVFCDERTARVGQSVESRPLATLKGFNEIEIFNEKILISPHRATVALSARSSHFSGTPYTLKSESYISSDLPCLYHYRAAVKAYGYDPPI